MGEGEGEGEDACYALRRQMSDDTPVSFQSKGFIQRKFL